MSDSDSVPVTPDYVVNIKWALEGLVMPTVGVIGIIGNLFITSYSLYIMR